MITYNEAIATVEAAGIPGRCAYVTAGDAYDYQDVAGVPLSRPAPLFPDVNSQAWKETNEAVEEWWPTPEVATRRWVTCETLLDELYPITNEQSDRMWNTFQAAGWESIGSGGFRMEVDPATVPETEDPFYGHDPIPEPTVP